MTCHLKNTKTKGVVDNLLVVVEISWPPLVVEKSGKRVFDI
jgi:hypothetical protein